MIYQDKLRSYIQQAKIGIEKAVEAISSMKRYPPQNVILYTYYGSAAGIVIIVAGTALIIRSRKIA